MRLLSLLLLFLAMACTPPLALKKGSSPDPLYVYMEFHPSIPKEICDELSRQLDDAIIAHNATSSKLRVEREDILTDENTLRIRVHTTRLIGKKENTTGILLSALGLSLPIAMAAGGADFIVGFYYFPQATSTMEIQLSSDIDGSPKSPLFTSLKTPGFLKSPQKQINKHGYYFNQVMRKRFKVMARQI
jgi:hypothetical protein